MPNWEQLDPQVRQMIAEGLTDTAIAQRLGLKRQTLVDHLRKQRMRDQVSSPRTAVEVRPGQSGLDAPDTLADVSEEVAMSTVVDIVPVSGSREALSRAEAQRLEDYEQIIAEGIQTFVQVGHALLAIRDQRLYRQDYGTFEEYLRQRWDLGRSYAHRMIDAAVVVENLLPIGNIVPANEAQARPLTSLPPEQQQAVWREAVETAPPSGITAKHVQQTVKRVKGATSTTTPAKAPRPDEPTAKKPLRIDVQERLFEALKSLPDPYAFSLFVRMYQWVDRYAIRHKGEIRGAAVRDNLNAIRERLTSATWLSETTPNYVEIEWGEAPDMSHTPKM